MKVTKETEEISNNICKIMLDKTVFINRRKGI